MGTFALGTFLFVVVTALAAVLFVFWLMFILISGVVHGVGRLSGAVFGWPGRRSSVRRCTRLRCGEQNPAEAHFCRRCGVPLAGATVPANNRVAIERA